MELTVLGSGPAWPNPGGACSGYLVSSGGSHALMECGPGVVGRLRAVLPVRDLSAVVVSHMHADHFLDLVPLRYGVKYGQLGGERPPLVLVPPGGARLLARIGRALDGDPHFFSDVLHVREYDPKAVLRLGPMAFSFQRVRHYVPAYAMRIEAGQALTFSGDAAPCRELVRHARGADALLCESALERADQDSPDPKRRGHMCAAEAGQVARQAGVGRLLITHCRVDQADPDRPVREARRHFDGLVELVREGHVYRV